jgi:hypothetical protein
MSVASDPLSNIMSNSHAASAAITRTGKAKYDPADSDLYSVNPCMPVKALPKKYDFLDNRRNQYYDVFSNEKLKQWFDKSALPDMIAGDFKQV